jgi:hypothetical protein
MHFSSVSSPWLVNSTSNVFFSGQPFTVTQTSGGFLGLLPILHSTCHPCGSTVLGVVNASLSLSFSLMSIMRTGTTAHLLLCPTPVPYSSTLAVVPVARTCFFLISEFEA